MHASADLPTASADDAATPAACPNCGAARLGPYCHACGQHHLEEPLRVRAIASDYVQRQLELEGGLLRTIVDLTVRPGRMIRDYLGGKRQRYMNPVAYTLLSATLYVLFLPLWIDRFRAESMAGVDGDGDAEQMMELALGVMSHPVAITLLTLVVFIPALRSVFPGRLTTAEAAVFSLYTFAHASILATLLTPLFLLVPGGTLDMTSLGSMVIWMAVMGYAAGGYFGYRPGTFLRIVAAAAVGMLGTMGLFVAFTLVYVLARLAT